MTDFLVDTPGVYDLPDSVYFSDPCPTPSMSAGNAKRLLQATPRHAADDHPRLRLDDLPVDEDDETGGKFDVGKATHAIVTGKGGAIIEIASMTKDGVASDSKNTKAWKEGATAARAAGDTPLLPSEAAKVRLMAEVLDRHLRADPEIGRNPFADRANNELAMFWRDGPTWFRAKPDAIDYGARIIWDLKTTDGLADPDAWTKTQISATGIDLRAAHYLHGAKRLLGEGWRYVFVVVEARRPHAISVVELPSVVLEMGEDKRYRAATAWTRCLALGRWPGWPGGIIRPEVPDFIETQWVGRRERHPSAELLRAAYEAQAPNH